MFIQNLTLSQKVRLQQAKKLTTTFWVNREGIVYRPFHLLQYPREARPNPDEIDQERLQEGKKKQTKQTRPIA